MRSKQRGFTLIELLVAMAAFAVIALALGSLFVAGVRAAAQTSSIGFVQRQGTLIQEELARQILPGIGLPVGNCGGVTAAEESQQVRLSNTPSLVLCFFRTSSGQFNVCTWNGTECSNTRNLLAGSPVPLRAQSVRFTPLVLVGINSSLDITFALQPESSPPDCNESVAWSNSCVRFGMNVTLRN